MSTYDPQNFESVLLYMRHEFGASVFRDGKRMHAIIGDLSPGLKPYANILRQLAERGTLSELENAAPGDERAMMKARYVLEDELFLRPDFVERFLGALRTLYGIAAPPQAVTPVPPPQAVTPPQPAPPPKPQAAPKAQPVPPPPQPQPVTPPTSTNIVKRGECGDNVTFTLDKNGVLTISGSGAMRDFYSRADMNPPWWEKRQTITAIKIQHGVMTIGKEAFEGCAALTNVTIPDSVTTIGDWAFSDCAALTNVTIPDSVTTIGNCAFNGCAGLISVTIPDSVTTIGGYAFAHCSKLKNVTIVDGVKEIQYNAFKNCFALTSVYIPDSVKKIEEEAFKGCANLINVSVPVYTKFNSGLFKRTFPRSCNVTRR